MKINGTPTNAPAGSSGAKSSTAPAGGPAREGSKVSLSDLATRLRAIESSVAEPFEAGRVEALKKAIREGEFKVNPETVADRLIGHLRQLLSKRAPG